MKDVSTKSTFNGRLDWFVRGAALKAWLAFRDGRLPLSPAWWIRALFLHWRESSRTAWHAKVPAAMDRDRFNDSYTRWLRRHHRSHESSRTQLAGARSISLTYLVLVARHSDLTQIAGALRQQGVSADVWLVLLDDVAPAQESCSPTVAGSGVNAARLDDWIRPDGSWLPPGQGTHVVFVPSSATIADGMAVRLLDVAGERADADWIYTDEDWIDDRRVRTDPYLKGAFNLPLAAVDDYASRLAVVRRSAIESAGGLRAEYGDAQVYELLLRIAVAGGRIEHLAEIGCHLDAHVPLELSQQHRAAAQRVIFGSSAPAAVELGTGVTSGNLEMPMVSWKRDPRDAPLVTIVMPIRDRIDLLRPCVGSISQTVDACRTQLLIVDDQSRDEETLAYLQTLERTLSLPCRVIKSQRTDDGFNYSGMMNLAAQVVETPLMLHLNNDIRAIAPGWLDQMTGWMSFPDTGVVGAKLLYPDHSIQHAGVVVSPGGGALEHFQSRLRADDPGYRFLPHRVREVSAVTGACLLTSTALFRSLGGFDARNFAVQFNDIDFCLRARQAGRRVIYEPSAVLHHLTNATRGLDFDHNETLRFLKKYAGYRDPFISPHLDAVSVCGPTPTLVR